MVGGGILVEAKVNLQSILFVTAIFAIGSILARSNLLAVLATLMLSHSIGVKNEYFDATYFLIVKKPVYTIILFSILATILYYISNKLPAIYERIAIASARTSVFLVNFGFWVGSLCGDYSNPKLIISDELFSVLWAIALIATAIWSYINNNRWVLNTVATFGAIHFYTQWFEHLGASPHSLLFAGLLALTFAVGIRAVNNQIKKSS